MGVRNTGIKIQADIVTWHIVREDHDDKKSKFFKNTEYVKFHERTKKKSFYLFILLVVIICSYILLHNI